MKVVRNIIAAVAAGSALSLGAAAFAQDAKKPEQPKAEAKDHQHRHGGMQRMRGMHQGGMHQGGMQQGGGCHGEGPGQSQGEHNHS